MSTDPQQVQHAVRRERTNEAFKIDEPVHNPRIAPRLIPVIVTILIGVVIIVLLYVAPWG